MERKIRNFDVLFQRNHTLNHSGNPKAMNVRLSVVNSNLLRITLNTAQSV